MITAKVSVTKKRPSQEQYSSDAFSATLEVELPDAAFLNGNGELREALSKLFKEVDAQVNDQINGKNGHSGEKVPVEPKGTRKARKTPRKSSDNGETATNRQVQYLIGLAQREAKMSLPELRAYCKREVKKDDIYALTKAEASAIIDTLKNGK
jgi:hypothetical protein